MTCHGTTLHGTTICQYYKQTKNTGFHHFPLFVEAQILMFQPWKFLNFTAARLRLRFASMQTVPKSLLYPQPGCLDMANQGGGFCGVDRLWRQGTLVEGNDSQNMMGWKDWQTKLVGKMFGYVWYVCDAVTRQLEATVHIQHTLRSTIYIFTDAASLNHKV